MLTSLDLDSVRRNEGGKTGKEEERVVVTPRGLDGNGYDKDPTGNEG